MADGKKNEVNAVLLHVSWFASWTLLPALHCKTVTPMAARHDVALHRLHLDE